MASQEVNAMRRLTMAIASAALMVLILASAASAASTPFAGVWVATDPFDNSKMLLTVSGGSAPTVTYQDFHASLCGTTPPSHWVATGSGTIVAEPDGTIDGLAVVYGHIGCGNFRWPVGTKGWFFFDNGTLFDNGLTAWYPLR
jgi:hypothetical protein